MDEHHRIGSKTNLVSQQGRTKSGMLAGPVDLGVCGLGGLGIS